MSDQSRIEPFDRRARQIARNRAASRFGEFNFLKAAIAEELAARAASFERRWPRILDLGAHDGTAGTLIPGDHVIFTDTAIRFARAHGRKGVVCDEDRLPFADSSFDLILSAVSLSTVNDLPGALVQIRRALRPGGVFLAGFVGGASLAGVRHAMIEAELGAGGGAAARIHPMIDAREAPALLQRAGFANPVVDTQTRTVRYGSPASMLRDVRGMGESNILETRGRKPLARGTVRILSDAVSRLSDPDGRIPAELELVFMTGRGV